MKILANDLYRQFALHAAEYEEKAVSVLRSGWYILGNEVKAFEEDFAKYIGAAHCVGLANGLDALQISFKLLGVGPGDEVIVSANAYIACVLSITMAGATPIFVEPDEYENIDASKIEDAVTERTKAILAVHLFGQACDMDSIMDIANHYQLTVVEDCAQSHGNHWKGQRTGTIGHVGCFSFYPTKGLGAFGDAGAITTNDDKLADTFRVYRNYGSRKKYYNEMVGTNSRLDEMQAGLLNVKLPYLDALNEERQHLADRYLQKINNVHIQMPKVRPGANSTWHQFVVRTKYRAQLIELLEKNEIGYLIHYPVPPHLSEAYGYLGYKEGDFPIAEKAAKEVLSLPIYNGMTQEEQQYVIDAVNSFLP